MKTLEANLKALQIYQPEVWNLLRDRYDSSFELTPDRQLLFLGRSWPLAAEIPSGLTKPVAVMVYGMADGVWLRQLCQQIAPLTPIVVVDSQPELVWACLAGSELTDLIADPRLQWRVATPDKLLLDFQQVLTLLQDQLELAWLENPPIAAVASLFQDVFLNLYRKQAAALAQSSLSYLPALESLYQDLTVPMTQAYDSYPLSCRKGCFACCEGSVGFHLCINPLEWALVHRTLSALPATVRQQVFSRAVQTLARHRDFLIELLHYFDTQPERIQDPDFHLELLHMSGTRRQDSCLFLAPGGGCDVYAGRPFTCRVFGCSHVESKRPFTCDIDYEQMEKILLDEGAHNRLVDSHTFRSQLWEIHREMPYKQVIHLWVLTHLDFETRDFKSLRVDYQQFQVMVRQPDLLEALLNKLTQAATV